MPNPTSAKTAPLTAQAATGPLTRYLTRWLDPDAPLEPADPLEAGLAHYGVGRFEQALPLLLKGLEVHARQHTALLAVGRILLGGGRAPEAIAYLQQGLTVSPTDVRLHTALGEALEATGAPAEAEAHFRKAIALNEKHTDAHLRLGMLYFGRKRFPEAIVALNQALHLDRRAAAARYYLAQCCIETGDLQRALAQLHFLLQLSPGYAPAFLLRATIFERLKDHRQVVQELGSLAACGMANASLHTRVGKAHLALGDKEAALAAFLQAVQHEPRAEAAFEAARLLEEAHSYDQALQHYRSLLGEVTYRGAAGTAIARIARIQALMAAALDGGKAGKHGDAVGSVA